MNSGFRVATAISLLAVCLPACGDSGGDGAGAGTPGSGSTNIGNCTVFPRDNAWNLDISNAPVLSNSDAIVDSIGRDTHAHPDFGSEYGIPFVVVPGSTAKVPVSFDYDDESDPGPYPIPPDVPVEDGGDSHVLVVDGDACVLYEMFAASTDDDGASWHGGSGAIFDLKTNATRPAGWTSADAAGLPIFPGLVRYEEIIEKGVIDHALRFTVNHSSNEYIAPATHAASSDTDPDLPAMGMRFRMKADFDCSKQSAPAQVLCTALKKYGMFVADNGSNWYISGAPDSRFDDETLNDIKTWTGDAFEAIDTGMAVPQN